MGVICVNVCHVYEGSGAGQKSALAPLEMDLQAVVRQATRVWGTELWSSVKAVGTLTTEPFLQPLQI